MEINIFDFLSGMEKDLAELYRRLFAMSHAAGSKEIFEKMAMHSFRHAQEVEGMREALARPDFDKRVFLGIHESIKASLADEVISSRNIGMILEKLSRAELLVSKMYGILSEHYTKVATYYSRISADISRLVAEEKLHSDMLRSEESKYIA